jgi:hypothetical protein
LGYSFTHDEYRGAAMTKSRLTCCAIALVSLATCGTLFATSIWSKKAAATTATSGIEVTALMSNVDAANLPATEIADLF